MTIIHDRRLRRRVVSADWPDEIRGRVRPGHPVRVIDLSVAGVLIETSRRLPPGCTAEIQLEMFSERHATKAAIVRSYVSRVMPDALLFGTALAFDRPIPWPFLADWVERDTVVMSAETGLVRSCLTAGVGGRITRSRPT